MTNFKKIKSWIPLPRLLPLRTFPSRLPLKLEFVYKAFKQILLLKMGKIGAKNIGTNQLGNALLRLNRDYPVGEKGFVIELPKDEVIFEQLQFTGSWEREISEFLATGLKKISLNKNSKPGMVDIGANCGFISLQTMNLLETTQDFYLIEPLPRHVHALRNNLEVMREKKNIHIFEFGLSDISGSSDIYTEVLNQGNSTIFSNVVKSDSSRVTKIQLSDTKDFCEEYLIGHTGYVIKSDTQGMDALILSRIPDRIWRTVESAVVEIWALPEIKDSDVDKLLSMWSGFKYIGWSSDSTDLAARVSLSEVREFWLSKSRLEQNLYLSKSY